MKELRGNSVWLRREMFDRRSVHDGSYVYIHKGTDCSISIRSTIGKPMKNALSLRMQPICRRMHCVHTLHTTPPSFTTTSRGRLGALRPILSAEDHLHRSTSDTPSDHAFSHLIQPRASLNLAPIFPVGIFGAAPQDFPGGRRSRPEVVVEIHGICLFAPHVHFTTENKVGRVVGYAGQWVVRVYQAPIVERVAVVFEGIEFCCVGRVEV